MPHSSPHIVAIFTAAVFWGLVYGGHDALHAQDMSLSGVLLEGENWQVVSEGHKFTEGPAVDATGQIYFTDIPESKIFRIDLTGKVSVFLENTEKTNGLMFGPNSKLYGCQNGARKIIAIDVNSKEIETIAEDVDSNDLVLLANGSLYFTDPKGGRIWFVSASNEKKVVAEGLKPNGIITWADQGTLVVTDSDEPILWTFRVENDGSLSSKERYYGPLRSPFGKTRPGSDGMTLDAIGRLYVTTATGLQMFDPTGRLGGVIQKPAVDRPLSNVVFGGEKRDNLYVTAGDRVYKRKTQTTGVVFFSLPQP